MRPQVLNAERRPRGRPPRVVAAPEAPKPGVAPRFRLKAQVGAPPLLQEAVPHPGGIAWRPVAIVPVSAPDWEDC